MINGANPQHPEHMKHNKLYMWQWVMVSNALEDCMADVLASALTHPHIN